MPLVVIGILIISGLGASAFIETDEDDSISDRVHFSKLVFEQNNDYVSVDFSEATTMTWEKDKPMIPIVSKVYTYPLGSDILDVEVKLLDQTDHILSKPVNPSPEAQIASTFYVSNEIKESKEMMTYSDIEVYPEKRFSYKTAAGLKDGENVIYLSLSIYPVQYIPKENLIRYSRTASIDITYRTPKNPVIFPDEYDFLIITPAEFESTLQRLVDHKNNLDPPIRTVLTTLDEIPSVGVDEQESIKYYIKDAKENWGISYVLLVGAGIEGSELFPVRKAYMPDTPHEEYFPTELYYADFYNSSMEFSDWDFDEDGRFAEYPRDKPDIDLLPDVYLGKMPCNNVEELNSVIDKIIYFKQHNLMTKKIVQVGGDSAPGDATYEGEYANEKVLLKLPGYSTTRLWGSNGEMTKPNIANGFKSNVDFVDLSGHGSYVGWSTHPPDDDEVWIPAGTLISPYTGISFADIELYRINNAKKYPVIVFTACSNNKYTMSENCIGWKFVCKSGGGSIATFAEAGIGWFMTNFNIVDRLIGWMEVNVFDELYNTKILGQAWANCVNDYYNTFPSLDRMDYKTMIEWSMFGDPTLAIENGDDPKIRSVNYPDFLSRILNRFPIIQQILKLI
jgi:hypothetical protein